MPVPGLLPTTVQGPELPPAPDFVPSTSPTRITMVSVASPPVAPIGPDLPPALLDQTILTSSPAPQRASAPVVQTTLVQPHRPALPLERVEVDIPHALPKPAPQPVASAPPPPPIKVVITDVKAE